MLRSLEDLLGYRLSADDGRIGKVDDFYFDDHQWVVRYLVADTGRWLPGRRVLISPQAIGYADAETKLLRVGLTQQQIEESPSIAVDRPMTRDEERRYAEHFGWPLYWELGTAWSMEELPPVPPEDVRREFDLPNADLRSARDVLGYDIRDSEGDNAGHVSDFIVDTDGWKLRYIVGKTRPKLLGRGKRVLLSPEWIRDVDWHGQHLAVNLTREAIHESPAFDPEAPVNRDYEQRLFDYPGRRIYWAEGGQSPEEPPHAPGP